MIWTNYLHLPCFFTTLFDFSFYIYIFKGVEAETQSTVSGESSRLGLGNDEQGLIFIYLLTYFNHKEYSQLHKKGLTVTCLKLSPLIILIPIYTMCIISFN